MSNLLKKPNSKAIRYVLQDRKSGSIAIKHVMQIDPSIAQLWYTPTAKSQYEPQNTNKKA